MRDESTRYGNVVSRRRVLTMAGTVGVASLAGCNGNSDGDGNGSGDGNGGGNGDGIYDVQLVSRINQVPTNVQWNPSNPSSVAQWSQYLLFDRFAQYNHGEGKFIPYAVTDWSFGDKSFTMKLRDGLTWADGDDVTTDDIATQLKLGMHTGTGYSDYTKSIEAKDDSTVVMHFSQPVNRTIVKIHVLANNLVQQKKSVFGKYLDEIEKNEKNGLRKLQNFAWKEPIASGPFAFKSTSPQQLVTERRDDHPDSDEINFEKYVFRYIGGGNEAVHQQMTSNQIDACAVFAPKRIVEQLPDSWQQVEFSSGVGYGLVPQFDHKHAGDRAVRQAIAYVLDRDAIVKNAGPASKKPAELSAGLASDTLDKWLGDAQSDFTDYGKSESKTGKATKVLKDAGYEKRGGTWHDSDGDVVNLPVQVPSEWSDWVTATQTVVDQLKSFGFKSNVDGRSFGNLQGQVWPNGNFVLASGGWLPGGVQATFPYFSLRQMLLENYRGFTYNYPAANPDRGGKRGTVTVPKRDGSGELTVNPSERLKEMSHATSDSKVKTIATEQAWVTNQDLPILPVAEKQTQVFLTDDQWDVPKEGATVSKVRWTHTWLPRRGKMNYKGK
ncbi:MULTISPECIES: ABC transporter substrate-binding protein [unclassified Haladaptatus]|uniref:ABC transporter substrate-binding protein n=1 Tax=unclassified Haladaptatus TaxID=2622732 RepID=UPI00209C46F3|nr:MULTISPECIES: ABC transporter substrate-binding protein [unclassified Haladaptatus]MCO8245704.1 ABC transporter substrate-binding protein [Haladaptatus sp. AB643]MCO8256050.1 ABC transporter substrate-binding protein [Haladaptatus sp. AB618]